MENKKIYVVLTQTYSGLARTIKYFTKDTYSHASISFDKECNEMYSFGRKFKYFPLYGIFLKEDLNKGLFQNKKSLIAIYEIEVTPKQFEKAKRKVKQIKKTNKGYNIMGLLLAKFKVKLHRNKYYCSEFVYEVLSSDGVDILDKNVVLFRPEELIEHSEFNKVYEGKIREYINTI